MGLVDDLPDDAAKCVEGRRAGEHEDKGDERPALPWRSARSGMHRDIDRYAVQPVHDGPRRAAKCTARAHFHAGSNRAGYGYEERRADDAARRSR